MIPSFQPVLYVGQMTSNQPQLLNLKNGILIIAYTHKMGGNQPI